MTQYRIFFFYGFHIYNQALGNLPSHMLRNKQTNKKKCGLQCVSNRPIGWITMLGSQLADTRTFVLPFRLFSVLVNSMLSHPPESFWDTAVTLSGSDCRILPRAPVVSACWKGSRAKFAKLAKIPPVLGFEMTNTSVYNMKRSGAR